MRLTVLGCAGSFGRPDSPCSSYLVTHGGSRLLVDIGPGALGALQDHGGLYDLDAVVVSHLHADHCLDLAGYVVARRYRPGGPPPPVDLHGPAGTRERVAEIYGQGEAGYDDVYRHHLLEPGERRIGPFTVTAVRVAHPVEAYALRISAGGRSLTYSGDTGPCDALVGLARDTDLFLCEASFVTGRDTVEGVHLTGRQAGEHATRAGARRLLLTHLVAWNDDEEVRAEAAQTYAGPLHLARPGTSYQV